MYEIHLHPVIRETWEKAPASKPLALQQHPDYGRALESFGAGVMQISVSRNKEIVALGLVSTRKMLGMITINTLMRGPIFTDPDLPDTEKAMVLKAIKKRYNPWRWNFLLIEPELPDCDETLSLMKLAKLRRVMTGYSTSWIDLRKSANDLRKGLNGKWRNQLVKAEKTPGIDITVAGGKPHTYMWLIEREENARETKGYHALPSSLITAFGENGGNIIVVSAMNGRKRIAGALFLLHGNSATYHLGWADEAARDDNLQNRIMWEAMLALKDRGISFLDTGGMNTRELAGIARFKLGMGGTPITYAGSYL